MSRGVCVVCRHAIDDSARVCPYCGSNPVTGEKLIDTQAVLQEVFKPRHVTATENVLEFATGIQLTLTRGIRQDYGWNGREPNVLYARRGDRYYDFSGVSGADFADDTRAFAALDLDGDGTLDLVLKSRLGPQGNHFYVADSVSPPRHKRLGLHNVVEIRRGFGRYFHAHREEHDTVVTQER